MIDELISKVGAAIRDAFGWLINFDWIPEIWHWYFWLFLLFLFCGVVIWFFGWSKIVRMVASLTFLAAAIFVAGGHVMSRRTNAKKAFEEAREKQRQQAAQRAQQQNNNQQPWRWPWEQ